VQLYVGLPQRSVTQSGIALKGFERVTLQPGERQTVKFTLEPRHLMIWNREMREVVEPGPVIVSIGNSSASLKQAEFTVA
jgi:beta-glucosidase